MTKYITTLIQIGPWYIKTFLTGGFGIIEKIKIPQKIQGYLLVSNLSKGSTPFATGLYEDSKKHKVIIKFWEGADKNVHYFNLLHQISVTKVLSGVQQRLSSAQRFGFAIPKYIGSKIEKKRAYLIMEYVPGVSTEGMLDIKKQWKIYQNCLNFLEALSDECTVQEKKEITTKSTGDFVFIFTFIFPAAMLMQPKMFGLLIHSAVIFLSGLPEVQKLIPNRLVHGDLHPDNILFHKNNCYLIDIENIRFCYPDYEPATSISLRGNPKEFREMIFSKLLDDGKRNKAKATLMINNAIHNMSGDSRPENVHCYESVLVSAINLQQKS